MLTIRRRTSNFPIQSYVCCLSTPNKASAQHRNVLARRPSHYIVHAWEYARLREFNDNKCGHCLNCADKIICIANVNDAFHHSLEVRSENKISQTWICLCVSCYGSCRRHKQLSTNWLQNLHWVFFFSASHLVLKFSLFNQFHVCLILLY